MVFVVRARVRHSEAADAYSTLCCQSLILRRFDDERMPSTFFFQTVVFDKTLRLAKTRIFAVNLYNVF